MIRFVVVCFFVFLFFVFYISYGDVFLVDSDIYKDSPVKVSLGDENDLSSNLKIIDVRSCESLSVSSEKLNDILQESRSIWAEMRIVMNNLNDVEWRYLLVKNGFDYENSSGMVYERTVPLNAGNKNGKELPDLTPLMRLLKSKKYDEIIKLISSGEIDKRAIFYGQYIITWFIYLESDMPSDILILLLNSGLAVDLDTLYFAIQSGLDQGHFDILIKHIPEGEISRIWNSQRDQLSIASYAAMTKNFSLASFLWKNGSPLVDIKSGLNVATQIPWYSLTNKEINDAVFFLLGSVRRPIKLYSDQYQFLRKALSKNEISNFEEIQLDFDALSNKLQVYQPLMNKFYKNRERLNLISECHPVLENKIKFILLSRERALYYQIVRKIYFNELRSHDPQEDYYVEIENALRDKKWQKVLQVLRRLSPAEAHNDMYIKVYFSMLEAKVDYTIYEDFIGLYTVMPDYLFIGASLYGNNKVATLLISRGADIHIRDKNGLSALQLAVLNTSKGGNLMIEYLLTLGVRFDEGSGPDAFSLFISRAHNFELSVIKKYVDLFKANGANDFDIYNENVNKNNHLAEDEKAIIKSWL